MLILEESAAIQEVFDWDELQTRLAALKVLCP